MKTKTAFFVALILLSFLITPQKIFALGNADLKPQVYDRRVKILRDFLDSYNSPLAPFASVFIKEADKNKLDWRFVAAISGVESTFGQQLPYNSYNAWGWGIYGDNMIRFASYEEAIETISKGLKERYIDSWGARDIYQIGRFYAASPTWAQRVAFFMERVDQFAANNPKNYLSLSL